jgi:phosphodiesterase/alkaline phosphatase D-like protein
MKYLSATKVFFILMAAGVPGSPLISNLAAQRPMPYKAKPIPPAKKAARVEITQGPALELFRNDEAIIRWTSNNPGGTDEHFGVVTYGTSPNQLNQTAKGHIRLNQNHPYTVFRVRMEGLKPGVIYYYKIDSMGADGTDDGVKSAVYHFKAQQQLASSSR